MMNYKVNCDFFNCNNYDGKEVPITEIIKHINENQKRLLEWPVDNIIKVIDRFGKKLLDRNNKIHTLYPRSGIPFIAQWCQRQNLEKILETAFESPESLNRFVNSKYRSDRSFRAFPKGIAIHWMAGNVPTLGFLSLIMGLLTKNGNIIKLAKDADQLLTELLEQMISVDMDDEINAEVLVRNLAVVRYDHKREDIGRALSENADVRIIWGGDKAVKKIKKLPAKLETIDIIFPNRTSFIVIGSKFKTKDDILRTARRIAMDISIFEQKACASPHTIFLLTDESELLERFAEALFVAMQGVLKTIPKTPPSEKEISELLNLRAQYDIFHDAWYSSGTEFTILSDKELKLGPPVGNRTIYLRMTTDIEKIADLITPNVQSVGIQAEPPEFAKLTELLGKRGVQRFTALGSMTHFESPWDGLFLPQYLVRWSSRQNHSTLL